MNPLNLKPSNILVLVLTYKQPGKTLACLSELLAKDVIPFCVLVWDNGSQDEIVVKVKESFPDVLTHYSEENLGVAGG